MWLSRGWQVYSSIGRCLVIFLQSCQGKAQVKMDGGDETRGRSWLTNLVYAPRRVYNQL
jgi:hypothetical protein